MEDSQHQPLIYDSRQADPTVLTTQLMQRELAALKEILETRLAGMDKAIELLQVSTSKLPFIIDEKVTHLRQLHSENFRSIEKQFEGIATLANQAAMSSKVAIDAALQAFDKATAKSEAGVDTRINQLMASTDKRFDQVDKQFNTAMVSRDVLIEAIRERTTSLETRMAAAEGRGSGYQSSWVVLVGAIGVIATIIGLLMVLSK